MDTRQDQTDEATGDLTALLGSRICHDLISPLGAIGNGVELLSMAPGSASPELALIAESVQAASARIRFFRAAFGAAGADQKIGRAEILSILADMTRNGRIRFDWQAPHEVLRADAKLAFLSFLCIETALPWGGDVVAIAQGKDWSVRAQAERIKIDGPLWNRLREPAGRGPLAAAHVQFALLPDTARRTGRIVTHSITEQAISIGF